MSNASEIFRRWRDGGYAYARAQVDEGVCEGTFLEFKQLAGKATKLEESDRQNLAKSLSGFANAGGGVLVWGVVTLRDEDSMRASALKPIAPLVAFTDTVRALAVSLLVPPVDGLEFAPLSRGVASDEGILVIHVPAVDGPPVMAKGPKQHSFYLRNDLGTAPMEHWQIADRFQRRPQPRVRLSLRAWRHGGRGGPGGTFALINLLVCITNIGRGLALHPVMTLQVADPERRLEVQDAELARRLAFAPPGQSLYRFSGTGGEVVHAGQELQVARLSLEVRCDGPIPGPLQLKYWIDCEGSHDSGEESVASAVLDRLRSVEGEPPIVLAPRPDPIPVSGGPT